MDSWEPIIVRVVRSWTRFLFGQKKVSQGQIHILNNGISINKFTGISPTDLLTTREQLILIDNTAVIGHVVHKDKEANSKGLAKGTENDWNLGKIFIHYLEKTAGRNHSDYEKVYELIEAYSFDI